MQTSTSRGAHERPPFLPLLPMMHPKKRQQEDNASLEGSTSKKTRLAWMAKSLMVAGVDVKFPPEE